MREGWQLLAELLLNNRLQMRASGGFNPPSAIAKYNFRQNLRAKLI